MPFSGIKLFYRELSSREQIHLCKANTLMPFSLEFAEDYGRVLREVISNCVKNTEDFYQLNIIEYILFLCKLRIVSIGEELELQLNNKESESDKVKLKITLNLTNLILNLYDQTKNIISPNNIEFDNLSVKLNWPLLNCESFFLNETKDFLLDSVSMFIESLVLDNKTICLKQFTPEQRIEIYNKLPSKLQIKIQENVFNIVNQFNEKRFFNEEISKYLDLNFYNLSYQSLLRLFFIENLESLYQLYFILASKNLSPDYVDKLSVSERTIYFSFLQQESSPEEPENIEPENL